jgi:hypothetical protein
MGMVVHPCNPSAQEIEAGYQVQGQPEVHRKILSQKNKKITIHLNDLGRA